MLGQQRKSFTRHGDRTKALGQQQRESDPLRSCNGHAKIISQELPEVLVVNSTDDQAGNAKVLGPPERVSSQEGPSHDDLPFHVRSEARRVERLIWVFHSHGQLAPGFSPYSEDALDERALAFHCHSLTREHLDDGALDVGR